MLLRLDFASDAPIYRQIRDQLVLGIAGGSLRAGEKLPPIRTLAFETGVNMMTINKAYQLLKSEGYITADRRGGTVVAQRGECSCAETEKEKLLEELRLHAASAKLSGVERETWLALSAKAYDELQEV